MGHGLGLCLLLLQTLAWGIWCRKPIGRHTAWGANASGTSQVTLNKVSLSRTTHNRGVYALASCTKSAVAQQILIEGDDIEIVERVAASPHLNPKVANHIAARFVLNGTKLGMATARYAKKGGLRFGVAGSHIRAAAMALRVVDDAELLDDRLRNGPIYNCVWGLRNDLVRTVRLEEALERNDHPSGQCVAVANPRLPESLRKSKLTRSGIERMARNGGDSRARVVKLYAILRANPWMIEDPSGWSRAVQDVILYEPNLTPDQVVLLTKTEDRARELHPAYYDKTIGFYTDEELLSIGNPACDEYVLRKGEGSLDVLKNFGAESRRTRATSSHLGVMYEAHKRTALDAYILRLGQGVASTVDREAATWIAPGLRYVHEIGREEVRQIHQIEAIFGESEDKWRLFTALLRGDGGVSWLRRAEAIERLVRV